LLSCEPDETPAGTSSLAQEILSHPAGKSFPTEPASYALRFGREPCLHVLECGDSRGADHLRRSGNHLATCLRSRRTHGHGRRHESNSLVADGIGIWRSMRFQCQPRIGRAVPGTGDGHWHWANREFKVGARQIGFLLATHVGRARPFLCCHQWKRGRPAVATSHYLPRYFSPASTATFRTFCFGATGQVVKSENEQGGL
jgi:hypothetical protein